MWSQFFPFRLYVDSGDRTGVLRLAATSPGLCLWFWLSLQFLRDGNVLEHPHQEEISPF